MLSAPRCPSVCISYISFTQCSPQGFRLGSRGGPAVTALGLRAGESVLRSRCPDSSVTSVPSGCLMVSLYVSCVPVSLCTCGCTHVCARTCVGVAVCICLVCAHGCVCARTHVTCVLLSTLAHWSSCRVDGVACKAESTEWLSTDDACARALGFPRFCLLKTVPPCL